MGNKNYNVTESVVDRIVRQVINEVRYIDARSNKYNGKVYKNHWSEEYNQDPITNDDKIRVFHGCDLKTACDISINGTSGRVYHPRQYSYESGMNPLGIFVTTDFETAKKFGSSNTGMAIIEFTAKASDLESPVWNGSSSYFCQGSMPVPFSGKDERDKQKQQYRQDALNTKDDYYTVDGKRREISMSHIRQSDKPELANMIFNNGEHQALFMGDLNPNMIKRIWVKLPHDDGYVYSTDKYQPMKLKDFVKRFSNTEWHEGYDYSGKPRYSKISKEKLFDPAENVSSFDDLIDRLYQKEKKWYDKREDAVEALNYLGMLSQNPPDMARETIKRELWPRQIIQLYGKKYFDDNFNRLGQ